MGKVSDFDKFGVEEMAKEEYSKKHADVMASCLCKGCPSYVEGDSPQGYCFPLMGTSENIKKEVDCLCSTCPVAKDYELEHTYYCTRCSDLCQTSKVQIGGGHE